MGYLTDLELVSLFLLSNKLGWLAGESQSSTCLQLPPLSPSSGTKILDTMADNFYTSVLRTKLRSSSLQGKPFTGWVVSSAPR